MIRNGCGAGDNATSGSEHRSRGPGTLRGARGGRLAIALLAAALAGSAAAQEYRIDSPGEAASAPVHLTEPVTGRVEVVNRPPVQEVLVVGGGLEQPVTVQGEVGLRLTAPLPVELAEPLPAPVLALDGPVEVTSGQPLRVWVENPPPPAPAAVPPAPPRYAAFAFSGVFDAGQSVQRRRFAPPAGSRFLLTDLTLATRPDAILYVRVLAGAEAVAGSVAGAAGGEIPLLVLDPRSGPSVRPGTPVPLVGPFTVQVTAEGPGRGAPFTVLAAGTVGDAAVP